MLVEIRGKKNQEQLVKTSRVVAEVFGKQYGHIIRDIEEMGIDQSNFGEMYQVDSYDDSYGRKQKMYLISRDGFSLLVMGYTGEKVLKMRSSERSGR